MYVQLRGDWPASTFHRGVRDAKGAVVKLLEWAPNAVLKLDGAAEIDAVADDIDKGTLKIVALKDGLFQSVESALAPAKQPIKKKTAVAAAAAE